ncbi:MAG: HD domain-containing protein [bacterium]|nr:HD domain-containing protein [bacterium]
MSAPLITTLAADLRTAPPPSPEEYASGPAAGVAYRGALSGLVDAAVQELFAEAWEAVAGDGGPHPVRGLALAFVGSQARRDAGPLSDLDCLLIHDGTHPAALIEDIARRLWYPIWDAGLRLDHSVRSLEECRRIAGADLPAAVGLLWIRHIAGDTSLTERAASAVLTDWRGSARRRLPDLLSSAEQRRERAGELAYLVEPDIKEARGGLRDAALVEALVATWLTDRPRGPFDDSLHHLLDLRDALHASASRPTARLGRHDQAEVAARLGISLRALPASLSADDPVDALYRVTAEAARHIQFALGATARRAEYALRASPRPFRLARRRHVAPHLREHAPGVLEHEGELVLAAGADPAADPGLALRLASAALTSRLPISTTALATFTGSSPPREPWSEDNRAHLLTLLAGGEAMIPVAEALDLAGLLTTWMPEWAEVRDRPQRAPIHRHTVDRHILETLAIAATLATELDERDRTTLLLAALLHDIGKVAGAGDHSVEGAGRTPAILERWGMGACAADVTFLVRHHLLLGDAVRSDPDDTELTTHLAGVVGDERKLDLLARLTEADGRAVGPQAWTEWRAGLLARLVERVAGALRSGEGKVP